MMMIGLRRGVRVRMMIVMVMRVVGGKRHRG